MLFRQKLKPLIIAISVLVLSVTCSIAQTKSLPKSEQSVVEELTTFEQPTTSGSTKEYVSDREQNRDQLKLFPQDTGWIDLKKDYGAKGDGKTDDTQAIIKAISASPTDYTRPKIIYFPQGTYLVSDTLDLEKYTKCCITFQGQGQGNTVIRLKNNSAKFNNPQQPQAVILTRQGNAAFRYYFRDLTVNTGNNNPGAIGIDYISNNRGAIENVQIKSGDGLGNTGLLMNRQWPGPCSIYNVSIEGFDYGMRTAHPEYSITLEHITLKNQNIAGISNRTNTLAIRDLTSINTVPAIQNNASGLIVLLDADLSGGSPEVSGIENNAYFYGRNLTATGYSSAITNNDIKIPGLSHQEYVSQEVHSLFDSPKSSLNLPIEETPEFHDNNLENWANVKDYPSIQAAMNSGRATIYFPQGNYELKETINVPASVRKIVGFESFINLNQKAEGRFRIEANSEYPLIIEDLTIERVAIEHNSPRTLAIKHIKLKDQELSNYPNSGKLFLQDVQMSLSLDYPQNVWARQLNPESLFASRTKVSNKGGNFWILGLKTEGKGSVIETTNGGRTELLGNHIYPVEEFTAADKDQAAFINNESSHSLIYSVSAYAQNRNYYIQIEEIRNGKIKLLKTEEMSSRAIPLFVGYK